MENLAHMKHPNLNPPNLPLTITHKINSTLDCKLTTIPTQNLAEELSLSQWRFDTEHPIFKILHFSCENNQNRNQCIAKVVYEMPKLLFTELKHALDIENSLYCFKMICIGGEKLMGKFGKFKMTLKMVGITMENECKIWVNEKLEKNEISYPLETEEEVVTSLIEVMEGVACPHYPLVSQFLLLLKNEKKSFHRMSQIIWKFSYNNQILIPPFFKESGTIEKQNSKNKENKSININLSAPKTLHKNSFSCLGLDFKIRKGSKDSKNTKAKNYFRHSEYNSQENREKTNEKAKRKKSEFGLNVEEKLLLKMNKSHFNDNLLSSGLRSRIKRANSKSDFLNQNEDIGKSSSNSIEKDSENTTKTSTKAPESIQPFKININVDNKREDNKEKMKNMIKEKLKFNREKKKICKLETINTVESFGEFTESEKRIIEEENKEGLTILPAMGRKIEESKFQIEMYGDFDTEEGFDFSGESE